MSALVVYTTLESSIHLRTLVGCDWSNCRKPSIALDESSTSPWLPSTTTILPDCSTISLRLTFVFGARPQLLVPFQVNLLICGSDCAFLAICIILFLSSAGVFNSACLIVKEPNGNFRPEHEWVRQGALLCILWIDQCLHVFLYLLMGCTRINFRSFG